MSSMHSHRSSNGLPKSPYLDIRHTNSFPQFLRLTIMPLFLQRLTWLYSLRFSFIQYLLVPQDNQRMNEENRSPSPSPLFVDSYNKQVEYIFPVQQYKLSIEVMKKILHNGD
jgi:hypothetical protein